MGFCDIDGQGDMHISFEFHGKIEWGLVIYYVWLMDITISFDMSLLFVNES